MAAGLRETAVGDDVLVWTLGGESIHTSYGTNCVGVLTDHGVLLVDPLIAPAHARLIDQALRARSAPPVKFVVLTHHHTDHTLGAAVFAAQGAVVVAHRACGERMAAEHPGLIAARRARAETAELFADAGPVSPDITFGGDLTVDLGGERIAVRHPGWGHTPGDAVLLLERRRVAIAGDLLFAGYHYNYEDASVAGVREGLRFLRSLPADDLVPGHGAPGGLALIEEQAAYHDAVEATVREAGGVAEEEVVRRLRARFPAHALSIVLPDAVRRFRGYVAEA